MDMAREMSLSREREGEGEEEVVVGGTLRWMMLEKLDVEKFVFNCVFGIKLLSMGTLLWLLLLLLLLLLLFEWLVRFELLLLLVVDLRVSASEEEFE